MNLGMEERLRSLAAVAPPEISTEALIVSIGAHQRVRCEREFGFVLEQNHRGSARRDSETRDLTERIDREAA